MSKSGKPTHARMPASAVFMYHFIASTPIMETIFIIAAVVAVLKGTQATIPSPRQARYSLQDPISSNKS